MNARSALFCAAFLAVSTSSAAATNTSGYEKCLSYPPAPGLSWSPATIEAFCADAYTWVLEIKEVRALIESGQGKQLDARLEQTQNDYFAGKLPEGTALRPLASNFTEGDDATRALVEKWLQQSPDSPFALTARGLHYRQRAADARGTAYANVTPDENFRRMEAELELAKRDLTRALKINGKILAAHNALIELGRLNGEHELAASALRAVLRLDPKNYYVRATFIDSLQPRWGGSLEAMKKFAAEAKKYLRKNPRLASLETLALAERSWLKRDSGEKGAILQDYEHALVGAPSMLHLKLAGYQASVLGQHQRSVELYSQVLRFWPYERYELTERASAYVQLGKFDLARADLDKALKRWPEDASVLREYGHLHMVEKNHEAALEKLLRARQADAEDSWTVGRLAWIYVYITHDPRKAEPLLDEYIRMEPKSGAAWLMRSEFLHVQRRPGLREALENFIRYADASNEEQRKSLPNAKAWLAKHPRT